MKGKEMRDIVISGATGFLGKNLARKFLENGDRVWAVIRPESKNRNVLPAENPNLKLVVCNLSDNEKVINTIKKGGCMVSFCMGRGQPGRNRFSGGTEKEY